MNTIAMEQQRTLREKMNRLNAVMDHSQITINDDPRIALATKINESMACLEKAERDALLEEWGY